MAKEYGQIHVEEFIGFQHTDNNVNILIGENGSGKSRALATMASNSLNQNLNTIAISTSIHDKFKNSKRKKFSFFGPRLGVNFFKRTLIKSIGTDQKDSDRKLEIFSRVFEYTKYHPELHIGFRNVKLDNLEKIPYELMSYQDVDIVNFCLSRPLVSGVNESGSSRLVPRKYIYYLSDLHVKYFPSQEDYSNNDLETVLRHEQVLRKYKVISDVEIYFKPKNNYAFVPINKASSGELMMLSTLIFIASTINHKTVILIDEPENSLHPRWQHEYVDKILDLFYLYSPIIVIATHSPTIIPSFDNSISIFRVEWDYLTEVIKGSNNYEETLAEVFGYISPENRFLSNHLVELFNKFENNELNKQEFLKKVEKMEEMVFDNKQKNLLKGAKNLLDKIELSESEVD